MGDSGAGLAVRALAPELTPLTPLPPKNGSAPPGISLGGAVNSAKGPVSRILSCAVIPLGAALPRTLISDLPGGFGDCIEQPEGAPRSAKSRLGASGRCAAPAWLLAAASLPIWSCSVWGLPCLSLYKLSGALLPHLFTLTPALELPQRRARPASQANSGIAFPGWPSRKRGSRGGFFSVALAVHEPLRPRPGRYPAHCPAEFGLSSPGEPRLRTPSGSDRPVLLPVASVAQLRFYQLR